ncbi:response regulator [Pararobbsia silviterrae]|uniref:histidine kinase n=2 Tax=Pararobbsia silviterrae TaxID=1792498 RepID=A0A494XBA5_9BURK|nr:response regulator [Pararobbsia silviterrae]
MEDYALRFTPRAFRKWSEFRVANTAIGAISFLALEAIGGMLMRDYGFLNALWAVLIIGALIFACSAPIAIYAAKHGVDIDLLTRGAGFGYLGSTMTSLIYASFTFIFFALEAAIMAFSLQLAVGMPLWVGYFLCSMIVVPLVTYGITMINRLQAWTQAVWLTLLVLPYAYIFWKQPDALQGFTAFPGVGVPDAKFDLLRFGAAATIVGSTVAQIGEQVDFLRFMPERTHRNTWRWWSAVLSAGPGWIVLGGLKMLGGAVLFYFAIRLGASHASAVKPTGMYLTGFSQVFDSPAIALGVTIAFVVICQIKINVTNAYAGSLAWSNFFSRTTHAHPGRVVWLVFNVMIAVALINVGIFDALERVLSFYSSIAFAWIGAIVADLVINKPAGYSPPGIEFKRSHLYDVNPVGFGSMTIGAVVGLCAYAGWLGPLLQAFCAELAFAAAFVFSPLIAWITGGKFYLARDAAAAVSPASCGDGSRAGAYLGSTLCCICEKQYEPEDMSACPAYGRPICSLCCSLDARCGDYCKPHARLDYQLKSLVRQCLPKLPSMLTNRPAHYLLLILAMSIVAGGILAFVVHHETVIKAMISADRVHASLIAIKVCVVLMLLATAIGVCCMTLIADSRAVAQDESSLQAHLLLEEIDAHRVTDVELQRAKLAAERANIAKSRFIASVSHELRTPLNSILGYAQLLNHDPSVPQRVQRALGVIRHSGDHVVSLIDGLLDIARIESGRFTLSPEAVPFREFMTEIADIFRLQAEVKRIEFICDVQSSLPGAVRCDRKRVGQILINVLGNAVKFTSSGAVTWRISYRHGVAQFEVEDTGPGISEADLSRIFLPFVRGAEQRFDGAEGTGLGLAISRMLTDMMGGELKVESTVGVGSCFKLRLFLPTTEITRQPVMARNGVHVTGYAGERRRILIVEDKLIDRELLIHLLGPLGFELAQAHSGLEALRVASEFAPHLILMDVNMPDLDGWEASRLLRANGISSAPILIVSAEAFDRGRENSAGIGADDFIFKPIRVAELVARIGLKLRLDWIKADAPAAPLDDEPANPPPLEFIVSLRELGALGYVRGILEKLDEVDRLGARYAGFTTPLRTHVMRFDLESFNRAINERDVRC